MGDRGGSAAAAIQELFSVHGKVIVVTGGSRGMGKEMCKAFALGGAHVVIASRKLESCELLADEINDRPDCSGTALPVAFNASDWGDCNRLVERVYHEFGRVDVLVNNAGGSPLYPSLSEISEELFDKMIGLNMKGPFRLSAVIGARMCDQDWADGETGSIINVSSNASQRPSMNAAVYGAAKLSLNYFTELFAEAYGPNVRCNCIQPGPFLTDISKAWDLSTMATNWKRTSALMRAGEADEVVGAALYFASRASAFTTGSVLRVDGGAGIGGRDPASLKSVQARM